MPLVDHPPAPSSKQEGTKIKLSLKPAAVKAAPSSGEKALVSMWENDPQVRLVCRMHSLGLVALCAIMPWSDLIVDELVHTCLFLCRE
jgi:hypothetical protein